MSGRRQTSPASNGKSTLNTFAPIRSSIIAHLTVRFVRFLRDLQKWIFATTTEHALKMGILHINMLTVITVSAVVSAELRRAIKSNEFELVEQMLLRRGVAAAGASRAGGDAAPAVTSSSMGFDLEQADADGVTLVMYCAMKGK